MIIEINYTKKSNMKVEMQYVDITPDKSIFHKIGEANYSISDAIAELVDNSVDATNDNGVEINIILDKRNNKIIISDNGRGMNKDKAAKSLVLAHSAKKDSLGEFGLGLKSACTSLGKKFEIITTSEGSTETFFLTYDKDQFMKDGEWNSFPVKVGESDKKEHGTTIEISSLRVKLYDALVTRLKDDLSQRYGPFIRHNNVVIMVGLRKETVKPCYPTEIELDENKKNEFTYKLKNGTVIVGWWGLRKIASGVESGFHLFRRGRLIRASEKLGYNSHPMANHITGEIHLDSIPVTHNKREFITESGEFREFIEDFWGDKTAKLIGERVKGLIDEITGKAAERWNQEKVEKQIPDVAKDAIKDNILRALNRVEDFKELAFPNFVEQKRRSPDGDDAPQEERVGGPRIATEEEIEDSQNKNEKRTPHKTKKQTAKFIMIGGKKFKFDFFWRDLNDENKDKETVVTENGIEIYINTGFKGFSLSKDSTFYCVHHIAEAVAETYLNETNQPIDRVFALRNKLIYEVASVVLEEEELKKLSKHEEELEKVREEKKKILQKKLLSDL